MLRFDRSAGEYVSSTVAVSPRTFSERVATLIAGGERPGAAFEQLLDERQWLDDAHRSLAERARAASADELPLPGSLVSLTLSRDGGVETLRARVIARGPAKLELKIVPAPSGAARLTGALVEVAAPRGRRLLGQLQRVAADGAATMTLILPAERAGGERRLAPRYLPTAPTHGYALMDSGDRGLALRVTLTDLGPTGFGFISPHPLPAGMPVALRLTGEADGETRIVTGAVVWLSRTAGGWRVGASING